MVSGSRHTIRENFYLRDFRNGGGFPFSETTFSLLFPDPPSSYSSRSFSPACFSTVRPPPATPPVPFSSSPSPLPNPTSRTVNHRLQPSENRFKGATAAAIFSFWDRRIPAKLAGEPIGVLKPSAHRSCLYKPCTPIHQGLEEFWI